VHRFKTAPETYALVQHAFGVPPDAVSFQSSNRWDVAGAQKFGFRTVWINRAGLPDEYPDLPPSATLRSLEGLLTL
jgi:2-haloacid dehalogenase